MLSTRQPDEILAHPSYLGVDRRDVVVVSVLLVAMYDDRVKSAALQAVADLVVAAGVRRDDVFVALSHNTAVDWYAGVDPAPAR